jgi:GH15 family glucan-1,4-alpha-glucosidase
MSGDYRPIGDYALIGDCHTAALVSRAGGIDWCCWPHLDSGAVFCRLLDARRGGTCGVAPAGSFDVLREYVEGTNVLATTFRTSAGEVRLTDFMPAERKRPGGRGEDVDESHQILRLVEGLTGDVEMEVRFHPTFDYTRAKTTIEIDARGATATAGGDTLRLVAPFPLRADPMGGVSGRFNLNAGQRVWFSLSDMRERDTPNPEASLDYTLSYWREWSKRCTYVGPYLDDVRRSALAQAPDIRANRCADRRADDVTTGRNRRRAQLGLPLRVAARFRPHSVCASEHRLPRRGTRLFQMARVDLPRLPGHDSGPVSARRRP